MDVEDGYSSRSLKTTEVTAHLKIKQLLPFDLVRSRFRAIIRYYYNATFCRIKPYLTIREIIFINSI